MGIQTGQFERIVECRARYCLWFWLGCCFCEPYTAFVVGKKLGMKLAVWRFLVFGLSLLVFRVILNNVAENFLQKLGDLQSRGPMSWEANVMPNSDHKLMFEPGVEVEKDLIEFVKHEDDFGEPTPEEEAVIRMANGLLVGFGIFVSLTLLWVIQRVKMRLEFDRMRGYDNKFISVLMGCVFCKCSIPQMAVYFEENPNDGALQTV